MKKNEVKRKVRKILDQIYNDSYSLPENFEDEVLEDITECIMVNHYNVKEYMTKEFITETILWCYMCRMQ